MIQHIGSGFATPTNSTVYEIRDSKKHNLTSPGDCSFIFGSHSTISLSTLWRLTWKEMLIAQRSNLNSNFRKTRTAMLNNFKYQLKSTLKRSTFYFTSFGIFLMVEIPNNSLLTEFIHNYISHFQKHDRNMLCQGNFSVLSK